MPNTRRVLRPWLLALCGLGLCAPVQAGADGAWTRNQVSPGLHALQRDTAVPYGPDPRHDAVPPGARITRVHVAQDYAGTARVSTRLCWRSAEGPCVALQGGQADTHAFDGLEASGPLLLVHRVLAWAGSPGPLFVRGSVTVWFGPGPAR